jgi:hypothetical protein
MPLESRQGLTQASHRIASILDELQDMHLRLPVQQRGAHGDSKGGGNAAHKAEQA